jgi:hypothetical protein
MGTRLNRDALRSFLNEEEEVLAREDTRETSGAGVGASATGVRDVIGDDDRGGIGGGTAGTQRGIGARGGGDGGPEKSSADAMIAGLLKQSKQNAATLHFGRVPFPDSTGDELSPGQALRVKRGGLGKALVVAGSKQRQWAMRFDKELNEMGKHAASQKKELSREAETTEEAAFEVAAASQAAWNEVMNGASAAGRFKDLTRGDLALHRIKPSEVRNSVVMDEAREAEEVIQGRLGSKLRKREPYKYKSDVWEIMEEEISHAVDDTNDVNDNLGTGDPGLWGTTDDHLETGRAL